jgi:hypothetical protein
MDKNFPKSEKIQAFEAIEKNAAAMGWDKNFIESLRKSMDSN